MDSILVERALRVARPEVLTVATPKTSQELAQRLPRGRDNDDDGVRVLTGAGKSFCSGADLDEPTTSLGAMRKAGEAARKLLSLQKRTIAEVVGLGLGAGATATAPCDLGASETARLSEVFTARGPSVDFEGSSLLPCLIGLRRARELVFLANMITVSVTFALGLISCVGPPDELDRSASDLAERLTTPPRPAVSLSKALLDECFPVILDQPLRAQAAAQVYNFTTEDTAETFRAWREQRPRTFHDG